MGLSQHASGDAAWIKRLAVAEAPLQISTKSANSNQVARL